MVKPAPKSPGPGAGPGHDEGLDAGHRPGRLAGLRVLIVEDEMLLAMDYEAMLQREGCIVIGPVPREAKALALIENERPDVAVLDLNLNGERPVALAETLTERGVPFVVVSGYARKQVQEPVFHAAPRLDKPLNAPDLIEALVALAKSGSLSGSAPGGQA